MLIAFESRVTWISEVEIAAHVILAFVSNHTQFDVTEFKFEMVISVGRTMSIILLTGIEC